MGGIRPVGIKKISGPPGHATKCLAPSGGAGLGDAISVGRVQYGQYRLLGLGGGCNKEYENQEQPEKRLTHS